jgi:hypothetical protein
MGLGELLKKIDKRRCNVKPLGPDSIRAMVAGRRDTSWNGRLKCRLPRNHTEPHEWDKYEPRHGNSYDGPWWK